MKTFAKNTGGKGGVRSMILFGTVLLLSSLFVSQFTQGEMVSGILFALFQILGILLPGMAIMLLLRIPISTSAEWIGFVFFFGYCFDFVEYLMVMLLGLQKMAWLIPVLFAAVSAGVIWWKRGKLPEFEADSYGWKLIVLFGGIMFVLSVVIYCGVNRIPPVTAESTVNGDLLYWTGNTIELKRTFPPLNFHNILNEEPYHYHYFTSMQLALVSMATGITPLALSLSFTLIPSVVLRVFAGYLVLRKCRADKKRQLLGMFLLFLTTGWEGGTTITYTEHLFVAGYGLEYGFAFFLIFLWFMLDASEREGFGKNDIVLLIVFYLMLGIKMNYAVIAICGMAVLCLGWLIRRKMKKAFGLGIPLILLFAAGYFGVVRMTRFVDLNTSFGNEPMYRTWRAGVFDAIASRLPFGGGSEAVAIPIFYVYYLLIASPICFLLVVRLVISLTRSRSWRAFDLSCLVMYLVSFVATIQITLYGISNRYFAMAAFPVAIIWYLYRTPPVEKPFTVPKGIYLVVFSLTAFLSFGGFCYKMVQGIQMASHNYNTGITHEALNNVFANSYINSGQLEAYYWLRDHTDEKTRITSNRQGQIVGTFSERYALYSGQDSLIFGTESEEELRKGLKQCLEAGIGYVVWDKYYHPDFRGAEYLGDPVFENDETVIFHIE